MWADTAYRSAANEAHLAQNGFRSRIHFRGQSAGCHLTDAAFINPRQRLRIEFGCLPVLSDEVVGR
jgi:hypothetical protein